MAKTTTPRPSRLSRIPAEDYAPGPVRQAYAGMLNAAGNPTSLRAFLLTVEASFLGFPALGAVLALSLRYGLGAFFVLVIVGFGVGALLPWLWLRDRVHRRRSEIGRELPGTLDLIAIATSAGLVIDAAVARVAELISGPLGIEMRRTVKAISLGQPRELAWEDMATRLQTPEVSRFSYSIVQAQQLGGGISQALHNQATQLRSSYAQHIRQRSVKMAVAMIFPVVFLVLPSIFLSVLGPAIFQLIAKGL